jgi:CRP-like cAMP-binding protein
MAVTVGQRCTGAHGASGSGVLTRQGRCHPFPLHTIPSHDTPRPRSRVQDEPRAATVTAVTDGKCLAMDRAAFTRLLGPMAGLLARSEEAYARYVTAARGSRASVTGATAAEPASGGGS